MSHDEQASQSPETVAAQAKTKNAVYVDPEVVRRRRAEKAAKKAAQQAASKADAANAPEPKEELGFLKRDFVRLPTNREGVASNGHSQTLKLMSWNVRIVLVPA